MNTASAHFASVTFDPVENAIDLINQHLPKSLAIYVFADNAANVKPVIYLIQPEDDRVNGGNSLQSHANI